jgi:hypothetical protein
MKKVIAAMAVGMIVLGPTASVGAAPVASAVSTIASAPTHYVKGYPKVSYSSKYAAGRFCTHSKKHTHSPRGVLYCRYTNGYWRWKYTR